MARNLIDILHNLFFFISALETSFEVYCNQLEYNQRKWEYKFYTLRLQCLSKAGRDIWFSDYHVDF